MNKCVKIIPNLLKCTLFILIEFSRPEAKRDYGVRWDV